MTGKTREEMMGDLKVQTAVYESDRVGTDHIGRRSELTVYEGFCRA
jgi:hypothetical protein